MKIVKIIAGIVIVAAIVVALVAPIGPLPGFFIGGTDTQAPSQWPDTSKVHEIKLEVGGTLPRVVIIWVTEYEGELYIAGSKESGWVQMIGNESPVRMRLGDNTYALTASSVSENALPILESYVNKYRPDYPDIVGGFPSIEEAPGVMALFHLSRS